jgi:hypothetical protein
MVIAAGVWCGFVNIGEFAAGGIAEPFIGDYTRVTVSCTVGESLYHGNAKIRRRRSRPPDPSSGRQHLPEKKFQKMCYPPQWRL